MVKADANEPLNDKKETTKKKLAFKKKTTTSGVWPCKINGCNKQFAREADLKRHQRTTKLHSLPSFACPQCDATFTRTDALRRHQKSRHNGIVLEPSEQEGAEDEGARSSGSQSRGSSTAPSSKGPPVTSTGPSSYYRQHTAASTSFIPPRPLQAIMDPQYAHVGIPTSAARMNATWTYPHPWHDNHPTPMGPISYHPPPGHAIYYPPTSHYRTTAPETQSATTNAPDEDPKSSRNPKDGLDHSQTATAEGLRDVAETRNSTEPDQSDNATCIDPSLSTAPAPSTQLTDEQVKAISLEITQAAMKAVLESARLGSESGDSQTPDDITSEGRNSQQPSDADGNVSREEGDEKPAAANPAPVQDQVSKLHGFSTPLQRPEPMEHMLTEDGEPMLNPAELLTQESLASPPPS